MKDIPDSEVRGWVRELDSLLFLSPEYSKHRNCDSLFASNKNFCLRGDWLAMGFHVYLIPEPGR